jgi:HK97 family phage major capsid protein
MDAVDPDFQPGAAFVMSQQTLNALHKLVTTGGGAYVFPSQQDATGRELLLGRKVYVSPSMGLLAAVGFPIGYGDFSKFVRRVVAGGVAIKSFPERNATEGKSTFESYLRSDAAILQTTTSAPIKLLSMLGGS